MKKLINKTRIEFSQSKKPLLVMIILIGFLCVNLVSAVLFDNLLACWSFEDNVLDSSGNGHDGIAYNSPTYTTGIQGNALKFVSGSSQYVNVTHFNDLNFDENNFSISLWVNATNLGTVGAVVAHSPGSGVGSGEGWFTLLQDGGNKFGYEQSGGGAMGVLSNDLVANHWEHFVVVRNDSHTSMWHNGTLVAMTANKITNTTTHNLQFGRRGNSGWYLTGLIDEVAIWNKALTNSEVSELWNNSVGVGCDQELDREIILHNPDDNYNTTDLLSINFNCSSQGSTKDISNITLFIDGIANYTHIGESDNFTELYHTIPRLDAGIVDWTCRSYDDETIVSWATNRTLNIFEGFAENLQIFNSTTIEGSMEDFEINISHNSSFFQSIQANLIYNGTSYVGLGFGTGNTRLFRRTINIPDVLAQTNMSFYWQIGLTNSTGTFYFNSSFRNQTVSKISIDNCTVHTNRIFNFTIVDEEDQELIVSNNSIEILVNIYNIDKSVLILNYSNSFNDSSVSICLDTNLSVVSSSFLVDSTVKYSAQDHEIEYYNIADYSLTNESEIQNIILYDLLTTDSTEFQLTFTGPDFLAVENALIFVKRQYVDENVFKTVELPKTDSNGQTILHLVRNDIVYNLEVMKDGVVIGNFENIIAFCDDVVIGDCKITLSSAESGDAIFNYDDALGITYTGPTYNSITRSITFNFLATDGSVKNILMNATRNDIFGNISICSAFVFSSGGTLTCEVPSYIDDSTIITKVFVDGIEILKDYTVLSDFNYGVGGYFIFFVYMLAFILMFSKSKSTMLIGILVGFIVGISLGLISGRLMGIGASGIWLVIVIVLMLWKLNKERPN